MRGAAAAERGRTPARARGVRRCLAAAFAAGAVLCAPAYPRAAASPAVTEYQMKAAFLRNFVKFVEWPSRPGGELTLCILGEDPFRDELRGPDEIGGGRTLAYRRIESARDAGDCQALFVGTASRKAVPEILAALAGREVLTIGDGEGMAKAGLMLGFVLEEQKVRFEANLEPVRRAGLTVSSRLLGLARTVHNAR